MKSPFVLKREHPKGIECPLALSLIRIHGVVADLVEYQGGIFLGQAENRNMCGLRCRVSPMAHSEFLIECQSHRLLTPPHTGPPRHSAVRTTRAAETLILLGRIRSSQHFVNGDISIDSQLKREYRR
jgi:hypothetical protein